MGNKKAAVLKNQNCGLLKSNIHHFRKIKLTDKLKLVKVHIFMKYQP